MPTGDHELTADEHRALLDEAGFSSYGVVLRIATSAVLVALII